MATNVVAPDEDDEVKMKDGMEGRIGALDDVVWNGGSDWQVTVIIREPAGGEEGEEGEEEEEEVLDVSIRQGDKFGQWREV